MKIVEPTFTYIKTPTGNITKKDYIIVAKDLLNKNCHSGCVNVVIDTINSDLINFLKKYGDTSELVHDFSKLIDERLKIYEKNN
jgi:hypothetical protein